jgi:uncharacterized protein (DUF1499 family)
MKLNFRKSAMTFLVIVILLPLLALLAAQFGAFKGTAPANLGIRDGRLKPPAKTPNSVTSQAGLYPDHPQAQRAAIAPLKYTGDGKAAMLKIARILRGMERTEIITEQPGYLYAQCTTRLMRFTDDVEFMLDEPAGVIQVRSASRIGHGDRGVNRARVEAIRHQLMAP